MTEEIAGPSGPPLSEESGLLVDRANLMRRLRDYYSADADYFHIAHPITDEAADEIERLSNRLAAIDKFSKETLRTNSKDVDDWSDDMAFVGKIARGL